MSEHIYRNTCPRNCFGTCGILSHVENGKLIKVTGDPKHGYNQGRLCAKGYAFTQFVYHPERLKYPMIQYPRGSGKWSRVSWDEVYTIIAKKMIALNQQYGSNLASGYNKFYGNMGILHYATEGMFNSIGPHTRPNGNPCSLTGKYALKESFGVDISYNPELMAHAKLIVIWGGNPAVTNVHQMKFVYDAKKKGATFVVIDPIFTKTAQKADIYIQIKPGTDTWLALGIAKLLMESGNYDHDFLANQTLGAEQYRAFIEEKLTLENVIEKTGVPLNVLVELSQLYTIKPTATWIGIGIQRTVKGIYSVQAISSLVALSGNLSAPNGGLYYAHFNVERFPLALINHPMPAHPIVQSSRDIDINTFPESALLFQNPPLKLLWIASRNIVSQDQNLNSWKQLIDQLELIVTVDLYLTKTAELSDIVLPAASHFEEEDLNIGYWHNWISYNQKAIPPYYEAKSDLQIARELTSKLNELSPGFSNFPSEKEPIDWIKGELPPEILDLYGFSDIEDLINGPRCKQQKYPVLTEKIKMFSPDSFDKSEQMNDHSLQLENEENLFQLLSPQSLLKMHSQYEALSWLNNEDDETKIEIPLEAALFYGIENNMKIEIYNEYGSIVGRAFINKHLPPKVVLAPQAGQNPINQLILHHPIKKETSTFFYDSFVKIKKKEDTHV